LLTIGRSSKWREISPRNNVTPSLRQTGLLTILISSPGTTLRLLVPNLCQSTRGMGGVSTGLLPPSIVPDTSSISGGSSQEGLGRPNSGKSSAFLTQVRITMLRANVAVSGRTFMSAALSPTARSQTAEAQSCANSSDQEASRLCFRTSQGTHWQHLSRSVYRFPLGSP